MAKKNPAEPQTVNRHHNYVMSGDGSVCVHTNGKRIDAADLYSRLVAKYGPECVRKPFGACFTVLLSSEDVYAVMTPAELAPRQLVDVPDERREPEDWHDVPRWAQQYIEDLEETLGIDHDGPSSW